MILKIYRLQRTQILPITVRQAWDFFSSPYNLSVITPREMNFKILSMSGGDKMHAGQIITYKVNVLPMVRIRWVTEISSVLEPECFIDEQRSGLFRWWHHKHLFHEVEGGVMMTDELDYVLPLGPLGQLAHWLFAGREVKRIFDHRYQTLEAHFKKN